MSEIKFVIDPANNWAAAPESASKFAPSWYKEMAQDVDAPAGQYPIGTAKSCSPFQDAMFGGYIVPLPRALDVSCDSEGEIQISWMPTSPSTTFVPISTHDKSQLPTNEITGHVFKFHVPWAIEVPEGYSVLYTHPLNRPDLPFQTFSGIVDGGYKSPVNIPFMWVGGEGRTILDSGMPIAQLIPFQREEWTSEIKVESLDSVMHTANQALARVRGYRRNFRIPKVWR